jgi:dTMP kinase
VSIEGISGTGKTYLADRLLSDSPELADSTLVLDEFSRRPPHGDLGHDLLRALAAAASGDPLLRGGSPAAETLMLLAIKAHDYEDRCLPALRHGQVVLEGRSLHCIAVYQSLILHPDDDRASREMLDLLHLAAQWRPLPDLTFLITDNPDTAAQRAEQRDNRPFSPDYRHAHHRAAALYDLAAAHAPGNITVIDRRHVSTSDTIAMIKARIEKSRRAPGCQGNPVTVTGSLVSPGTGHPGCA